MTWEIGDVLVLRHAGFPFELIESLGWPEEVMELAERLLDAEEKLRSLAGRPGSKAERALAAGLAEGREPRGPGGPDWEEATTRWRRLRAELANRCATELPVLRARLNRTASLRPVQDAVFLSNPAVWENVWERYVRTPEAPDTADRRRAERVVYGYLQRFCAKNETTSFFGPIGYGELTDGDGFEVVVSPRRPGRAFLSFWAAGELARAIRRPPGPGPDPPIRPTPAPARTGEGAARDSSAAADRLLRAGRLARGLSIPSDAADSLPHLRERVAAMREDEGRTEWLERLDCLAGWLADFASARGRRRREVFARIEEAFVRWTGVAPRRGQGEMYADRLVLYEEAPSPFHLRLGRRTAQELARLMTPALELCAAYGWAVQGAFRRQMTEIVRPGERLDFAAYAMRARPQGSLESRFAPLSPVRIDVGQLEPSEVALETVVAGQDRPAFGGVGPRDRYALPDVFLAAPSPQAVQSGGYRVVLGRVHHHLLIWGWLSVFHPRRDRFEAAARRWLERQPPEGRLVAIQPRRRNKGVYSFPGPRVLLPGAVVADPVEAFEPTDLTVEGTREGPVLHGPDGRPVRLYLPLADYCTYPPFAALAHPLVLHPQFESGEEHTPRLTAGEVVYQRDRWWIRLDHVARQRGVDLLLAVSRERRARGWPRFLFARIPSERKPQLVDLSSPFGHELLRRLVRTREPVTLEEMLPGPEDLWLRDARGRYTCELRLQAVRTEPTGGRGAEAEAEAEGEATTILPETGAGAAAGRSGRSWR